MGEGNHSTATVELARLPSGMLVETTIHRYEGSADGPMVYVQAAQHGREVNGTEALRRFHDRLPLESLSGTILAVPVANPLSFDRASYVLPAALDSVHPNMNRVWPGNIAGTLHERMAATLWSYVDVADAVVDLHTSYPDTFSHVMYQEGNADSRALAEAYGTALVLSEPVDEDARQEWHRRNFAGKFRVVATQAQIPAITPELSHSREIVEDAVEEGVRGLLNVLRHLDMLPGDVPDHTPTIAQNHLGRVVADTSGLFRPNPSLEPGVHVAEGATIGSLYNPTTYECLQHATANCDGMLYGLRKEATVIAGDELANVALLRDD